MKYLFSFTVACCLLLSACGESTSPDDNFSTNARDFLFAGNVGTEIVFIASQSDIDTNGVKTISPVDTIIWTIMDRNAAHPITGSAIRIRQEQRRGADTSRYVNDSAYYAFYNESIVHLSSLRDIDPDYVLKNPLTVGTQWIDTVTYSRDTVTLSVKSNGEIINTPYKQLKTVRVESLFSSKDNTSHYKQSFKYYHAPEVLVAHAEIFIEEVYPSQKKRSQETLIDLLRYTKK
jgi:hypothetical protein